MCHVFVTHIIYTGLYGPGVLKTKKRSLILSRKQIPQAFEHSEAYSFRVDSSVVPQKLSINFSQEISDREKVEILKEKLNLSSRKLEREILEGEELKIDLNAYLPSVLQKGGEGAWCEGINCWNTVLRAHGESRIPLYSSRPEMVAILNRKFRVIDPALEKLKYGDIVSGWSKITKKGRLSELLHSAFYVGENLFFHKADAEKSSRYEFVSFENAFLTMYVDDKYTIHRKLEE